MDAKTVFHVTLTNSLVVENKNRIKISANMENQKIKNKIIQRKPYKN